MTSLLTRRTAALLLSAACLLMICASLPAQAPPGAATPQTSPSEAMVGEKVQQIDDAWAKFTKRDFAGALDELKGAVEQNPTIAPADVLMAKFLFAVKQASAARASLESAVSAAPDDPEAYVLIATFALSESRNTEAAMVLAKAQEVLSKYDKNPKRVKALQPQVYHALALIAERKQDWSTAQKHLEAWLALDVDEKTKSNPLQRLAWALFKQDDAKGANLKLKDANTANPESRHFAAVLGGFYHRSEDLDNAKTWFEYALKVDSTRIDTVLTVAEWYLQTGQLGEAKNQAAVAAAIDSNSMRALILQGVVALFQKDYPAAESFFEKAHVISPGNFAASNNLALALAEQDSPEKKRRGLEYADKNVRDQQNAKNAEAASTYGWVLYRNGKVAEADRVLSQLVRAGRFSEDTGYYAAVVAAERGRKEEAKTLLEAVLKSKRPFSKKQEAKALLEQLKREN